MAKLKTGLVGAGVFGGYHAGKLAGHDRVDFVGVYDPSEEARTALAAKHGTSGFDDLKEMVAKCDAVVIAAPAVAHGEAGVTALEAGCHVLVEKPVAASLYSAEHMVELAAEKNLILQVGHQERFVMKAIGVDKAPEKPTYIRAHRFGTWSPRGSDVSVTLDLMTHDLDMVIWLMGNEPSLIEADVKKVKSDHIDKVRATLTFPGGRSAELAASRVEDDRDRVMLIEYPSGRLEIDFVNKTFENDTTFPFNANFGDDPSAKDSLGAGTDAFIRSVLDGEPVLVSGEDGLKALKAALEIDGKLEARSDKA